MPWVPLFISMRITLLIVLGMLIIGPVGLVHAAVVGDRLVGGGVGGGGWGYMVQ